MRKENAVPTCEIPPFGHCASSVSLGDLGQDDKKKAAVKRNLAVRNEVRRPM